MIYSQKKLFQDKEPRIPPGWPYAQDQLDKLVTSTVQTQCFGKNDLSGQTFDVDIRFLNQDHFDQLITLHKKVVAHLPKREIFRSDEDVFFQAHMDRRGKTVGAFIGDQLIGYAVVSFPKNDPDNLGKFMNLQGEDHLRVAHFDGASVNPDYRGSQLHRLMNKVRGTYAFHAGYHHMFGTVSPLNPYSLMNHLSAGFEVVDFTKRYGGMDRLIIYRNGLTKEERVYKQFHMVNLDDRQRIKTDLQNGYIGTEVIKDDHAYHLCLGK
ncbi:hypothetical protein RYZ26_12170 [Terasakiella sp. A23]|uniref:GNAT family N-acetyltransferase n=1 Tax=Terasakiella sp. FCG-A23 TaxID=3080561 RepID=UPI002955758E|nr:GNAT family N-acetyltransferase [Terasakiella sp. A23]MDV7340351.1 hypothetical protein [Terasakiella sp. A23]